MDTLRGRRVLVTGAAGFIGANLVRDLARQGAEVHAVVRASTDLWRIADILPNLHLHRVDLIDREGLKSTVRRIPPEVIFHLTAHGVSPLHKDSSEVLGTNVLGTVNLLEATAPLDYHRLVHFGSSLEYGPKNTRMSESDLLEPVTFFGATKAAATLICQQFARAHRRPVVVLRPFSVYGYWEAPTRLVPTAILAILRNQEISLTSPGYRRDLIFVEDVVEACLLAVQADNAACEIINIGTGQQWANEKVVEMVEAIGGRKARVRVGEYPPRPSDTHHWVADIRKAKRLLGWEPRHTLRSGLEKTVSWFRLHLDAY